MRSEWEHPFRGWIDEVAIFDRGVTESEVHYLNDAVINGVEDKGAVFRYVSLLY